MDEQTGTPSQHETGEAAPISSSSSDSMPAYHRVDVPYMLSDHNGITRITDLPIFIDFYDPNNPNSDPLTTTAAASTRPAPPRRQRPSRPLNPESPVFTPGVPWINPDLTAHPTTGQHRHQHPARHAPRPAAPGPHPPHPTAATHQGPPSHPGAFHAQQRPRIGGGGGGGPRNGIWVHRGGRVSGEGSAGIGGGNGGGNQRRGFGSGWAAGGYRGGGLGGRGGHQGGESREGNWWDVNWRR